MKNLVVTLLILFSALEGPAQTLGVTCYNNPSIYNPEFRRLTPCSDGGYIAHSGSGQSGKAVKMNSTYTAEWSYEVQNLFFIDNVETNDGNYVFVAVDVNFANVHVLKFNPTGVLLWQKVYSTPGGFLNVSGIAPASGNDNGFIFFGGMSSQVMHYVVKCDAGGSIVWTKEYTGIPGAGSIYSVITEPNGYVAVASSGVNHVYSAAVLRLDTAGNVLDAEHYASNVSGNGIEVFRNSLSTLSNGNYFL